MNYNDITAILFLVPLLVYSFESSFSLSRITVKIKEKKEELEVVFFFEYIFYIIRSNMIH